MAKIRSTNIAIKFTKRINTVTDDHRELLLAINGKMRQARLESMLTEQFTFNIAVLWEGFLDELLLAHLVNAPDPYLKKKKEEVLKLVKKQFGLSASQMIRFMQPKKISLLKARGLVDQKNYNISIRSARELSDKATELLAAKYARLFNLSPEDADFFNFVIALRNYLGHRSDASRETVKRAVANLSGAYIDLKGPTSNIGIYLKSTPNAHPRSIIIGKHLIHIANKLV